MYLDHIQEDNEIRAKGVVAKALAKWKSQGGRRHIEGSYGISGQPVLVLVKAEGREGLSANRLGMANNGVRHILPLPSIPSLPSTNFSTALIPAQQSSQEALLSSVPTNCELHERFEECAEHEEDNRE